MKKILMILLGVILLTGCTVTKKEKKIPDKVQANIEDNSGDKKTEPVDNNTLTCTADEVMFSVVYKKEEEWESWGKTIFTFQFKNDEINEMTMKEIYNKEHSTEENYKEAKEMCLENECKASLKNDELTITYNTTSIEALEDSEMSGLSKKEIQKMMEEMVEETSISIQCK